MCLPTGWSGVSRPVARGQKFMCCARNPRNTNIFVRVPGREESGTRPVTGVTEKLFMCQMFMCLFRPLISGKGKHINKFAGLSRDWVGAKKLFICFLFSGHSLWGRKNTLTKFPPKSWDNPVNSLFTCFFLYVFFLPSLSLGNVEGSRNPWAIKFHGRPGC